MSTDFEFKKEFSFESRQEEAHRVRRKYPRRIPVICELTRSGSSLGSLDKNKYLVPEDLTVGQFAYIIRKRLTLKPETAIFILVNNSFPSTSTEMCVLYDQYQDSCGFLYLKISGENTFGF